MLEDTKGLLPGDWVCINDGGPLHRREGEVWGIHRRTGVVLVEIEADVIYPVWEAGFVEHARKRGAQWNQWKRSVEGKVVKERKRSPRRTAARRGRK